MQTASHGLVLKFSETLDGFIPIQYRNETDIANTLNNVPTKEHYLRAVVHCCVKDYETRVGAHIRALTHLDDPLAAQHLEEEIFELCLQVNPKLALDQVTLPQNYESPQKEEVPENQLIDLKKLQTLEKKLKENVLGQESTILTITQALKQSFAGLKDESRPLASFCFAGSTGVGKTELAKTLTQYLFEDPTYLLRIDGSEYALPHEAAKLIGAPPGYIGHEQGGQLTHQASKLKKGVLLIDEIEKADPKVHNMLLQILDEGHLTDNHGTKIFFHHFVVILTTNTGAFEINARRQAPGFNRITQDMLNPQERHQAALSGLKETFSPEFLNRLDHIFVFNELDQKTCAKVIDKQIKNLCQRCLKLGFTLQVTSSLKDYLLEKSFHPAWGAREIRRQIQKALEYPLSHKILEVDLKGCLLRADIDSGCIRFFESPR